MMSFTDNTFSEVNIISVSLTGGKLYPLMFEPGDMLICLNTPILL